MPPTGFDSGFSKGFGWFSKGYVQLHVAGLSPKQSLEDGDVCRACNWRRWRHMRGEPLCTHHPETRKQLGGMLGTDYPLAQAWHEAVSQYRYVQDVGDTCLRYDLHAGGDPVLCGPWDSSKTKEENQAIYAEHIWTRLFIRRRLGSGQRPMFGSEGAVVWYGGRTRATHEALDTVWAEIEDRTAHREADIVQGNAHPFGKGNERRYLIVAVNDFTDAEGGELTAPLMTENPEYDPEVPGSEEFIQVKQHKHTINWRALQDVVEADVLAKGKPINIHAIRKHVRSEIVQTKSVA